MLPIPDNGRLKSWTQEAASCCTRTCFLSQDISCHTLEQWLRVDAFHDRPFKAKLVVQVRVVGEHFRHWDAGLVADEGEGSDLAFRLHLWRSRQRHAHKVAMLVTLEGIQPVEGTTGEEQHPGFFIETKILSEEFSHDLE